MIDQLEQAGAPEEVIETARKRMQPVVQDCEVWEENWISFKVFQALGTQWNIAVGVGALIYQGINYASIPIVMRRHKISIDQRDLVFDDVQTMERAAKEVLNAR